MLLVPPQKSLVCSNQENKMVGVCNMQWQSYYENLKGRDHTEYLDINGGIILKYILVDVDDMAQMHYGL